MKTIGILIPTLNAEKHIEHCLKPFLASSLKPKILVIDSSSTDATVTILKKRGIDTCVIPKASFNHGATREMGRKRLNTDIVVMLTPDAHAINEKVLDHLIQPLLAEKAAVSYARQIPHNPTNFFETFPRTFNYPENSQLRSIDDLAQHGVYTFFCSNSCAAYSNRALDHVGGFPTVEFGEDTLVTAKLLRSGYSIAYVAEALVKHSHSYSLREEFERHYKMGKVRAQYKDFLGGGEDQRGKLYVKTMTNTLLTENPKLLPYAVLQTLSKWLGYKLGSKRFELGFKD